ncbi:MAG: polysaccharide transport protein [Nigerium sp.]|nr:polysaccharide transport protein [Nigerium sp.]
MGLVVPSILIQYFGSDANGLVGSVRQFVAYLSLAEMGMGVASMAALYRPLRLGDGAALNAVLAATRLWYLRSGWVFGVLLVILCMVYPLVVASDVPEALARYMMLILGGGALWEYLILNKYRTLLHADQRVYVLSTIQAVFSAFSMLAVVMLAREGCGLIVVQLGSTGLLLLRAPVVAGYVRRRYPAVSFKAVEAPFRIPQQGSAFVQQLAAMAVFNSPIVILTVLVPLDEISVYLVHSMIFVALSGVLSIVSTATLGGFGQLVGGGELAHHSAVFRRFETMVYCAAFWMYSCAAVLTGPFLFVYTARFTDAEYIRPEVVALFVAVGLANSLRVPHNVLVTAAGMFAETRSRAIAESVINVVCSVGFAIALGMPGVLIGALCSYAFRSVDFVLFSSSRILGRSPLVSFRLMLGIGLGAVVCVAVGWPTRFATPASYVEWLGLAIPVAAGFGAVFALGFLLFSREARVS